LFKKLFGKGGGSKAPKGFYELTISAIRKLTDDTVEVSFDIASDKASYFKFTPGQYINFAIEIEGKEERRSYSICSGPDEKLAVAVKQVENGKVSTWFNKVAAVGEAIFVSPPEGNFVRPKEAKNIVAIAVGSGITPIMSMAKAAEGSEVNIQLFYGSRTLNQVIFRDEISALTNTTTSHFLSAEDAQDCTNSRINKESFTQVIKNDLEILKSDGFFICGPEEMIVDMVDVLKTFGVSEDKVFYELFTTPTVLGSKTTSSAGGSFSGTSKVTVILDDESVTFDLASDGANILDKVNDEGFDAPYSCKGGVCCTCKAKVVEGNATMTVNYSLTDKEVEEGYILTCQAHPASETLKISYDD
jgi:ring-1,2-phenylacetyl-CoA epoxidase subunit PaaE